MPPGRRRNPVLPNNPNAPTQVKRYHSYLATFMEYHNGVVYPDDKVFTVEELRIIKPEDIYKWFCVKAYGVENPGVDDNPTGARHTWLAYAKKSISHFMESSAHWDERSQTGNPTKCKMLNKLIQAVKKKEIRNQGKKSNTDREFRPEEFVQLIDMLGTRGQVVDNLRMQATAKLQLHVIGRSDDMAHIQKTNLEQSMQFRDYLSIQLRWSKNVQEERDCPKQVVVGCMNAKYCPLLALSLFLEKWVQDGDGAGSQWLLVNGVTDQNSPLETQERECTAGKNSYSAAVKWVIESDQFVRIGRNQNDKLGTHSIRKYATTMCRDNGASTDDIDYRARWKVSRMQDRYTGTQLHWPDIHAASKLCLGGICKYKVKDGSGITNEWLSREVAPAITASFGAAVGNILAKALLWACYEPSQVDLVPADLCHNVTSRFILLESTLADGINPIEKVEVIASQMGGTISLDEIPDDALNGRAGQNLALRTNVQWRNAIYAKVASISLKVTEMQNQQIAHIADVDRRLRRLTQMVRGIAVAPARRRAGPLRARVGAPIIADARPAVLSAHPRTLHLMWEEYTNGIGGNKAARDFTAQERGRCKYKYSRRLVVWKCIERLVVRGNTLNMAFRRIANVYGDVSMTRLITNMRADERRGGHHRLRL